MSLKLLVADDETFIREAYKDGLTHAGFSVSVASNGAEALEMIQAGRPDIVLLDLIMPRKSGFDVLKALKADEQLRSIPVIILSNLSQVSDENEARQLGAAEFLVKSDYSLKQLAEKVTAMMGKAPPVQPEPPPGPTE